jgi:hypothetical protein
LIVTIETGGDPAAFGVFARAFEPPAGVVDLSIITISFSGGICSLSCSDVTSAVRQTACCSASSALPAAPETITT